MRLRFILLTVLLCFSAASYAFNIDGMFSTAYEVSNDKGEDSENLWENYLSIDNAKVYDPYLGLNFYGRYADDDDYGSSTDIYSAYLDYSNFQSQLEIKLGRFAYVGNRFLTLDGAEVTYRTESYFGVTGFAGAPRYFDSDGRHVNESFRSTGDKLYGGKIFLNGVKNTTGYISYSKEDKDSDTLQEFLGAGLGRRFDFGDKKYILISGRTEYDMEENDMYKGNFRVHGSYDKLNVIYDFTRFNVQDGSAYEDELIISNFSSGEQDRYSLIVQYALNQNLTPYVSGVYTELKMPSDEEVGGDIYKAGLEFNWFKEYGLTGNIEGYKYESDVSNASGGSLVFDWYVRKELLLTFESEMLRMENSKTEDNIYSVYLEAAYSVTKDLTVSVYGENNQETRYLPENRYGVKAVYSF